MASLLSFRTPGAGWTSGFQSEDKHVSSVAADHRGIHPEVHGVQPRDSGRCDRSVYGQINVISLPNPWPSQEVSNFTHTQCQIEQISTQHMFIKDLCEGVKERALVLRAPERCWHAYTRTCSLVNRIWLRAGARVRAYLDSGSVSLTEAGTCWRHRREITPPQATAPSC